MKCYWIVWADWFQNSVHRPLSEHKESWVVDHEAQTGLLVNFYSVTEKLFNCVKMAKDATAIDDTKSVINAGSNICSICSLEAVSRCQRCLSIVYCSKECQQRGWSGQNSHRKICAQIKKAKEKVEEEENKLKSFKRLKGKKTKKPKDCDFETINLFDSAVGKFWEIKVLTLIF